MNITGTKGLPFNHNSFDVIDTPEKAYWLGVLYTDGNVNKDRNYISLETKDLVWLKQFQTFIKSTHKIMTHRKGNSITWSLRIGSQYLCNQLNKYGIVPNKTYNHSIPVYIPEGDLESHFWRGCIDGDGCIAFYPNRPRPRAYLILTGCNYNLLKACQKFFASGGSIYKTKAEFPHYQWSISALKIHKIVNLLNVLYKSSQFASRLERKYNIYRNMEIYSENLKVLVQVPNNIEKEGVLI